MISFKSQYENQVREKEKEKKKQKATCTILATIECRLFVKGDTEMLDHPTPRITPRKGR